MFDVIKTLSRLWCWRASSLMSIKWPWQQRVWRNSWKSYDLMTTMLSYWQVWLPTFCVFSYWHTLRCLSYRFVWAPFILRLTLLGWQTCWRCCVAASFMSSLAHTRAGIPDAMLIVGAIDLLKDKLYSSNDQVGTNQHVCNYMYGISKAYLALM